MLIGCKSFLWDFSRCTREYTSGLPKGYGERQFFYKIISPCTVRLAMMEGESEILDKQEVVHNNKAIYCRRPIEGNRCKTAAVCGASASSAVKS